MAYSTGDVIFSCEPWVYSVNADQADERCHRCLASPLATGTDLIVCPGCGYAKYCSQFCSDEDLELRHRLECSSMKNLNTSGYGDIIPTDILLAIRILIRLQSGNSDKCVVTGRSFESLMAHEKDLLADSSRLEEIRFFYSILTSEVLQNFPNFSLDFTLFVQVMGKLQCNAFG
ncbi:hypothetical protein BV898_13223 [Hypsibius exemplaris]|uniref:MYND-type domain-containing protein n=1 Tax=Hypsibius exemplaris TaxID=2072580 RepID=A0A1W0WBF0_HYPEX|nr:hypothetical protein BV898_13223 [Hypsibius exemplaris]